MTPKMQVVIMLVAMILTAGVACAEPSSLEGYSHAELTKMIHVAHTQQQYEILAGYYRVRQQTLEQQAQSEKFEWEHLRESAYSHAAKYPRPVDALENHYENLKYEAQRMSRRAAYYESLSASAVQ